MHFFIESGTDGRVSAPQRDNFLVFWGDAQPGSWFSNFYKDFLCRHAEEHAFFPLLKLYVSGSGVF